MNGRGRETGTHGHAERREHDNISPAVGPNDIPVEIFPTTAREHVMGCAALNIPNPRREGGDWHEAWFDIEPRQVAPEHVTDEKRFGRLLDRLGSSGLRDARAGLALLGHPAESAPARIWAATHERAVVEMAWARLRRMAGKDVPVGLPPIDHHDFYGVLPHPDQWVRVRWWAWRLQAGVAGVSEGPGWRCSCREERGATTVARTLPARQGHVRDQAQRAAHHNRRTADDDPRPLGPGTARAAGADHQPLDRGNHRGNREAPQARDMGHHVRAARNDAQPG